MSCMPLKPPQPPPPNQVHGAPRRSNPLSDQYVRPETSNVLLVAVNVHSSIYDSLWLCKYWYPPNARTPPTKITAYRPIPASMPPPLVPATGPALLCASVYDLAGGSPSARFRVPTSRPSRISRASSLCPTSSKASVASWPPTSSRTSSPPLLNETVSAFVSQARAGSCRRNVLGEGCGVCAYMCVCIFIDG